MHVWQIGALAPLQEAREGNLEYISSISSPEMQRLIKGRDEDGRSLLHSAVSGGSAALVDYLIQNGAAGDVNSADDEVQPVVVLSALGRCCAKPPPAATNKHGRHHLSFPHNCSLSAAGLGANSFSSQRR